MDTAAFENLALRGEHVCDVHIIPAGNGPGKIESAWGGTMIDYIASGEFEGPRLRGRVLPGGGDWPKVSIDGAHSLQIDARAVWETHDGVRLYVRYEGFIVLPEPTAAAYVEIASLDPSAYYFRTAPIIRCGDARYAWLNKTLFVGIGRFLPGSLGYRIFAVA